MRRSVGGAVAALAALAIAVPAAHARGGVEASSVDDNVRVEPGKVTRLTVTCPKGFFALSGAAKPTPAGVRLLTSHPRGNQRKWTFRFGSTASEETTARTVVRCGNLDVPRGRFENVRLRFSAASFREALVEDGETTRVKTPCPSNQS